MGIVSKYTERLSRRDPTLKRIDLFGKQITNSELRELADCLLTRPDVVTTVDLGGNRLTDETGVKLARYVAASSTIEYLDLRYNQLGSGTYLAMAAALSINTSLKYLSIFGNPAVDRILINAAVADALRLNPDRPAWSNWWLYSYVNEFKQIRATSEQLGHPTLQMILNHELEKNEIKTAKRVFK